MPRLVKINMQTQQHTKYNFVIHIQQVHEKTFSVYANFFNIFRFYLFILTFIYFFLCAKFIDWIWRGAHTKKWKWWKEWRISNNSERRHTSWAFEQKYFQLLVMCEMWMMHEWHKRNVRIFSKHIDCKKF